jgi:hypothetical protein
MGSLCIASLRHANYALLSKVEKKRSRKCRPLPSLPCFLCSRAHVLARSIANDIRKHENLVSVIVRLLELLLILFLCLDKLLAPLLQRLAVTT